MRGAGGAAGNSRASDWMSTMQPLSIVLIVVIIGATFYLWRQRMLRSRAALIVIAAVICVLIYFGFFSAPRYERYLS